jgi:glyoxylase-like metal-dependent hydrolase (beta-lactamase superfamily II)
MSDQDRDEDGPVFERAMPAPGAMERVAPLIRRRVAANGGAFTASGTCTYVVGTGRVAVVDPGPDESDHIEALLGDLAKEQIVAIVITHTHRDHSPGARRLAARTGAPIVGCGPHRAARPPGLGETAMLDASADQAHTPDRVMTDGDTVSGPGWTLVAVETPGHTMNHLAFALPEADALFSGDHVMAWSTTIVAPPDGAMQAYMASLEKLRGRTEATYWPGHGGPVREPARFLRGLAGHRRQREAAIRARLAAGDTRIPDIVAAIYRGLDPRLTGAAALSVFAHMEDLVGRGLAACDGAPSLTASYAPA